MVALSRREAAKILGVAADAEESAIRKAYRKLALKNHPDKAKGSDKEKATKKFQSISTAYVRLTEKKDEDTDNEGNVEEDPEVDMFAIFQMVFSNVDDLTDKELADMEAMLDNFEMFMHSGRSFKKSDLAGKDHSIIMDDVFGLSKIEEDKKAKRGSIFRRKKSSGKGKGMEDDASKARKDTEDPLGTAEDDGEQKKRRFSLLRKKDKSGRSGSTSSNTSSAAEPSRSSSASAPAPGARRPDAASRSSRTSSSSSSSSRSGSVPGMARSTSAPGRPGAQPKARSSSSSSSSSSRSGRAPSGGRPSGSSRPSRSSGASPSSSANAAARPQGGQETIPVGAVGAGQSARQNASVLDSNEPSPDNEKKKRFSFFRKKGKKDEIDDIVNDLEQQHKRYLDEQNLNPEMSMKLQSLSPRERELMEAALQVTADGADIDVALKRLRKMGYSKKESVKVLENIMDTLLY